MPSITFSRDEEILLDQVFTVVQARADQEFAALRGQLSDDDVAFVIDFVPRHIRRTAEGMMSLNAALGKKNWPDNWCQWIDSGPDYDRWVSLAKQDPFQRLWNVWDQLEEIAYEATGVDA